jgi:AsmA-like C-terminal region
MSRCLRPCLIALAAVFLVVFAAVVALNIHLQSTAMQQQLRQAAMDSVGLPLSVRSAIYTPWDGIRLRGLVMPDMENAGVNFLEASEFQILFRLMPLLRREFVVSDLRLKEAVLTWRQNANGQWRVPRQPEEAVAVPAGTPVTVRPAATPEAKRPAVEIAGAVAPKPLVHVRVDGMQVRRSRILFENRDGWPLLDADGITANADLSPEGSARGEARVPEAVLAGLIVARELASDFTLEDGQLRLAGISGEIAGGQLSGRGEVATRTDGSPYEWDFKLDGFRLSELRLPSSFGGTRLEGTLNATLAVQGRNAPQRQLRGKARVDLTGARMIPSEYLRGIGQALGIRELQNLEFKESYAELRLEDDFIHVAPLWLRADEFAVEMSGPVTRAGGLDLQARLILSPASAARIAAVTGRDFPEAGIAGMPGFRAVAFRVTGTLEKPQSDLAARVLGGGIGGKIGEFFLNFLGTP